MDECKRARSPQRGGGGGRGRPRYSKALSDRQYWSNCTTEEMHYIISACYKRKYSECFNKIEPIKSKVDST